MGSSKEGGRDSITLNLNDVNDDSLILDIPDVLPPHLAGDEVHMTQMSLGFDMFGSQSHQVLHVRAHAVKVCTRGSQTTCPTV